MKYLVLLTTFICLSSTLATAGNRGLAIGGNIHKWGGSDASDISSAFNEVFDSNYAAKFSVGFSLGAFYEIYNNKTLSIQPELHWIMKGTRYKGKISYDRYTFDTQIAFNMNYIEMPLLAKLAVAPVPNQPNLNIIAGPFVAFNVGTTLVVSVDDEREEEKMDDFESTCYGYILGGGIRFPSGFFFDIRYHRDLSSALGDADLFNQVIGLYFGIAY